MRVKRRKRNYRGSTNNYALTSLESSNIKNDISISVKTNSDTIKTQHMPSRPPKLIVYINEFDKTDDIGNPQCRNNNCTNPVCKPFRKYCSLQCSKQFTIWYNSNFYWRNVRNSVLRRDDFTCQLCGIKLNRRKKMNKGTKNWLECDHIIPKSFYKSIGYEFNTLEDKVKTILEFVHNRNNLRTLCYQCHRKESNNLPNIRSRFVNPED